MAPEFRPARVSDRPVLVALLHRQLQEHGIAIGPEGIGHAVDGVFADPSRGSLTVACHEGAVVGVSYLSFVWTMEHGGKSAWLEELYVVPESRAFGIGTALLETSLEAARGESCRGVDLEVEVGHERVEGLYLRHGFVRCTRSRWFKPLGPSHPA